MSRRGRGSAGEGSDREETPPAPEPFNTPFRGLGARLGPLPSAPKPPATKPKPTVPAKPSPAPATEGDLFAEAVRGVKAIPLAERSRRTPASPRPAARRGPSDEESVMIELSDLVAGTAAFDVSDTEEHMEGAIVGLDPRLLRRLRAGEFSYQSHIDLHGFTADEAYRALLDFVHRAMSLGHRCVLVVHGRGLNSPQQRSVLKNGVREWLTHGELGRRVLAFCSARLYDGGAGATYVLLRRERRGKQPFRTFEGTRES